MSDGKALNEKQTINRGARSVCALNGSNDIVSDEFALLDTLELCGRKDVSTNQRSDASECGKARGRLAIDLVSHHKPETKARSVTDRTQPVGPAGPARPHCERGDGGMGRRVGGGRPSKEPCGWSGM